MVEAIISMVMGRLCDAAVKEVLFLHGVEDQVKSMMRELGMIQCFLRDADNKRGKDARVNHWVGEVRDVGHMIEDAIDNFLVEVNGRPRKSGLVTSLIARVKKVTKLAARYKLGKEIKKIQDLIREIAERGVTYGIKSLDECGAKRVTGPIRPRVLPDIENTDVVGFEADTKNIINLLVDGSVPGRAVISIVGTGGLGKTTLAQKAYKRMMDNHDFEYHIWLSISQEFKLIELLKKMLKKLCPDESNENLDEEEIMTKIHRSLETKKYLIVLDDVWTKNLWSQFETTLPDANNGSRVLMTTRNREVALAASYSKPYELSFLNEKESEELLLKRAFRSRDPNEPCFNDLNGLVKQFTKKCGGLPLALVVVGGLLSQKETNYTEWEKVLNNINWKECTDILASSYDDLPVYLKPCFTYFACFPEDFEILEDAIIKMWISEGFIPQDVEGIMEDTAASYLEELVQRCMVQMIERQEIWPVTGRRYLRIHDLLRDLAIHEAREESNLTILSKEGVRQKTKGPSRRATLQNSNLELIEFTGPNLRSLLCFNNFKFQPDYSGFRMLKVLSFMFVMFSREAKLDWLRELIHLRYLGFIFCWHMPELPHDIDHCKNLQALHIVGGICRHLPESIWSIKALRHLIIDNGMSIKDGSIKALRHVIVQYVGGNPIGPPAWAELTSLLTLGGVEVPESWMTRLPRLTSLRTLHLCNKHTDIPWDVTANLLCELNHLISLTLTGENFTRDILDTRELPSYEKIQFLELEGKWVKSMALDASIFPLHLTELILIRSYLKQDPMLELKTLVSLRVLVLGNNAYWGNQMTCSAGGFHRLQQLTIVVLLLLKELRIEENSMPMLNKLKLSECSNMQMLPDLQHVPTIRKLELIDMPDHINSRVQHEDHHKIKHVPLIEICRDY